MRLWVSQPLFQPHLIVIYLLKCSGRYRLTQNNSELLNMDIARIRSFFSFKMVFSHILLSCTPAGILYMRFLQCFNVYHSSQRKLLVSRQYRSIDKSVFSTKWQQYAPKFFPGEYGKRKLTLSTPILFFNSIRPSAYLNSQEDKHPARSQSAGIVSISSHRNSVLQLSSPRSLHVWVALNNLKY